MKSTQMQTDPAINWAQTQRVANVENRDRVAKAIILVVEEQKLFTTAGWLCVQKYVL